MTQNNPDAFWVFQSSTTRITAGTTSILLINGALTIYTTITGGATSILFIDGFQSCKSKAAI